MVTLPSSARSRTRPPRVRGSLAFAAIASVALGFSWFLPWWQFRLLAPQYPQGLELVVFLYGLGGDVQEVDTINHYIGMARLEDAAPLERAWSGWIVAGLALALFAAAVVRLRWLPIVVAAVLPVGFLVDTWLWLHHYGHSLDPEAPLTLKAFTPVLFGEGHIGQFGTRASPMAGFWLALVAVIFAVFSATRPRAPGPTAPPVRAAPPPGPAP
ncbi:MAG: cytochrome C [Pseudomonadota bacterium]|nr:cytochrome C [Pseudomonadota bacterium]